MKLTDERIIEFLNNSHSEKPFDLDRFISPSENDFRDIANLKNLQAAAEKINLAVSDNKKILIYGDYDSDGICSSTILYLFLKSKGADVNVFIPNRFENGYGISVDAIDEIVSSFMPDLIITVDLGITAVEEFEILKQEGIEVVITDHHLPLAEIPDCLVVDPKICVDEYGFDGLCGAGVALKLVEAMSSKVEAAKYLDLCAIATVGDIVPLVDENRAIAKLGIDKINSGDCLKSIKYMLEKLEIVKLNSYDISFKIVPRLNACGRMDEAFKVVDFLIEEDENLLKEKYLEIEGDNTLRLAAIDKGNKIIDKTLNNLDSSQPSILVVGDFHEGVVGILASRVCHEYLKPTIIFTKTENGTLKGSGRSIESVDLHKIISEMPDILENFGGHKMAVGVEILPENFELFKDTLNSKLSEILTKNNEIISKKTYDILLTEDDFSNGFFDQIDMLEPFGCENEKPIFALKQNELRLTQISEKTYKHYRCYTAKNNIITAFNASNLLDILRSKSEKLLLIDYGKNTYHGTINRNFILSNVIVKNPSLDESAEADLLSSIYNLYYSIFDFNNKENYLLVDNTVEVIKKLFSESNFGTLVVVSTEQDLKKIEQLNLSDYYSAITHKNGQNTILISPKQIYKTSTVSGYKNIIFLHKNFDNEHLYFSNKFKVYEPKQTEKINGGLMAERQVFASVYKHILSSLQIKAVDEINLAEKLAINFNFSASQILFCMLVFMELNFIEFDEILGEIKVCKSKKMELESSKLFNEVKASGTK